MEKNQLVSKKQFLEERLARLVQKQNAWFEPYQEWLKDAQTLAEVVSSPSLALQKTFAQKIFGSNLFLKNKEIEFTPKMHWATLRAANEKVSKMELSLVLVAPRGIEPRFDG
jgi:hypothetical protein